MICVDKGTIIIDVDSTIWPAEDEYDAAAQELYGIDFYTSEGRNWYDVGALVERFGANYQQLFRYALTHADRELYPNAAEAFQQLVGRGYRLHFLSHHGDPDHIQPIIERWLYRELQSMPYEVTVIEPFHSKTLWILDNISDAKMVIEDQPNTLVEANKHFEVLARSQPWNIDTCYQYGILVFNDWKIVPRIADHLIKESELTYA